LLREIEAGFFCIARFCHAPRRDTDTIHHPELRRSSTHYGVDGRTWHCPIPRAALRLHGVTHIMRLRRISVIPRRGEKFFAPTTPKALHFNNPVQAVRRSSGYTDTIYHPELRRSSTLYGVGGRAWHCPKPRAALRLHGATYLMRLRRIRIIP
jgi:hypothetical protein